MSLRWRFALILAASTIVVSVAAGAAAVWSTSRALTGEVNSFLITRLAQIPPQLADQLGDVIESEQPIIVPVRSGLSGRGTNQDRSFLVPDALVQVVDADGSVLLRFEDAPDIPVDPAAVTGRRPFFATTLVDGVPYRFVARSLDGGGAVLIARDITENASILTALRARVLAFGSLLAAAAAVAGWFIARRTVRPIEELSDTARHVAETQDLDAPITVDRDDEVGQLAISFNTMLQALQESREQQHRLVMDASHELRTPLTSLRTNIEVLKRSADLEDADRKELLDDVGAEMEELTALVSELVDLATDRRTDEAPVDLDLADIVSATVERSRRRTDRAILLTAEASPIHGRPGQLDRAVWNLLENADKWSPPDAPIDVTVANGQVTVMDHGPGFDDEDLPHIFERFYRATDARTLPGSGLGLAIVAQIVETHGGQVHASNRTGGGATVGFHLPTIS
jgi:two-component system sensor histidine kinase MprB